MKKKSKVLRNIIIIVIVVVVIGGGFLLLSNNSPAEASAQNLVTYTVEQGDIDVEVTGSGTIDSAETRSIYAKTAMEAADIPVSLGDEVKKGDIIANFTSDDLDTEIKDLESKINEQNVTIGTMQSTEGEDKIVAPAEGRVKIIYADKSDDIAAVMKSNAAVCIISSDGKLKLTYEAKEGNAPAVGDKVEVKIGKSKEDGIVQNIVDNKVTVTINEDKYDLDVDATVFDADDNELGSGKLEINMPIKVTANGGIVRRVYTYYNETVDKNEKLFGLKGTLVSVELENALTTLEDYNDDLKEALDKKASLNVTAPFDGVISTLDIAAGDKLADGAVVCKLQSSKDFEATVAIDELDIAKVKVDQTASLDIDALPDSKVTGKVKSISKIGTSDSGVTRYNVTLALANTENVMSGMSVSADIKVDSAKDAILVPVEAVQTIGEKKFVMVASSSGGSEIAPKAQTGEQTTQQPEQQSSSNGNERREGGNGPSFNMDGGNGPKQNSNRITIRNGQNASTGQTLATGGELREVEIGLSNGTNTQILSGLSAGETIIYTASSSNSNNMFMMMGGAREVRTVRNEGGANQGSPPRD